MSLKFPTRTALVALSVFVLSAALAAPAPAVHPAPSTVSDRAAALVSSLADTFWAEPLESAEAMTRLARGYAESVGPKTLDLAQKLGIKVGHERLAGVPVYRLSPVKSTAKRSAKTVLYLHGGGYVLAHGASGLVEALPLVSNHGFDVVSVDYRMAPEHPYPAAIEDAFAVYKALAAEKGAENIVVYGTSTGGAMTLFLGIQIARAGLAMPAGFIAGTPWTDLTKTGDSYTINENVDNVLVRYEGLLSSAVRFYAGGRDLKDPLLSPVYAEEASLKAFSPVLLIAGTRDLFLSNTVRMHKRFLLLKKPADLIVYEALSHAQYYFDFEAPETVEHYRFLSDWIEKLP